MPKVQKGWCDQILVLDGGSTDGTAEYAKQMGYDVYIQKKKGLRSGYKEVWPLLKGDWVITFSPDGNSPPEYIPKLIQKMREGYDMVIGSRYYRNATSEDDDIITAFGNLLFTAVINALHKGYYSDAMTIYRIYKKELFYKLALDQDSSYEMFEKLFFTKLPIEILLSARCAKEKLRHADIACSEPPRIGGTRKLQIIRWGFSFMAQVIWEKVLPRRLL